MNEQNLLFLGYFVTVFLLAFNMYRTVDFKFRSERLEFIAFIYSTVMMVFSAIGFFVTIIIILFDCFVR